MEKLYGGSSIATTNTNRRMHLSDALGIVRPIYWYVPNKKEKDTRCFEMEAYDADYARDSRYGVFFVVNEVGDVKNHKGHLRHEDNVTRFTSVFVDFDDGTKEEQQKKIGSFSLKPSAIVESGRGYHVYWFLEGKVDRTEWSHVQTEMALSLGGDTACSDPARLMRLPDTWHTKGEHVLVSTIWMKEEVRYTLAAFLALFPLRAKKVFALSTDGIRGRNRYKLPSMILAENHRHPELKKVGARFFRGVLPSEVQERTNALKAWYMQSCRPLKPEWENEVEEFVNWLINKEL